MTGWIPRQSVFLSLVAASALLAAMFVVTHLLKLQGYPEQLGFRRLFNMDGEGTLPAWFSSVLLLSAGAIAAVIAATESAQIERFRWHWVALAIGLLYMSADEAASIHEMFNRLGLLLPIRTDGMLDAPWVVFGMAISAVVALAYLRFLFAQARHARTGLILAATCYLGGALGVEMLTARLGDLQGLELQPTGWTERGDFTADYMLLVAVEEFLEMLGVIILIDTLLGVIGREAQIVRLGVRDARTARNS